MPRLTEGQRLAIAQLEEVAAHATGTLEIVDVHEPRIVGDQLVVHVSIDCSGLPRKPDGIELRGREQFLLTIGERFPFGPPSAMTLDARWPGNPHVQWSRHLCLYLAWESEWQPNDGMYGFLDRLWEWLKRAALAELDPVGGPMHPPVAYASGDSPLVVMRADTPQVVDDPWVGWARLEHHDKRRADVVEWSDDLDKWPDRAAVAILLTEPLDFEFPTKMGALIEELGKRNVRRPLLMAAIRCAALHVPDGEDVMVIIGAPMRGTVGGDTRQHLAVWAIEAEHAKSLRNCVPKAGDSEKMSELRAELESKLMPVMDNAGISWCTISEARPEIVIRRDHDSTFAWFQGRAVAVWGCGAIGAHIAEWLVRAGAKRIVLRDDGKISPGILARQPYVDTEVGAYKAEALGDRLRAIDPKVLVEASKSNVLHAPLGAGAWDDDCDVVIDATASTAVSAKLEAVRDQRPDGAVIVGVMLGHTAEHGIAAVCPPNHSGAITDVLRQVHLRCSTKRSLLVFKDEFWPSPPRADVFQPEPGCSDATFVGATPDVVAIAACLMRDVARELGAQTTTATAHLVALPKDGRASHHRIEIPRASLLADGIGSYEVRIGRSALAELNAWIRRSNRANGSDVETGGHLFGMRDDASGVIWVDEVSGPPPDSTYSAKEFACGTQDVPELIKEKRTRTGDELRLVGMWHTHPGGPAFPSDRDLVSMLGLVDLEEHAAPYSCMLIAGSHDGEQRLGAYVFSRKDLPKPFGTIYVTDRSTAPSAQPADRNVGLALSGGGARAIAFHLGCMRALHDRGALERLHVISSVSGGSIIAAMWAYSDESFEAFDQRVSQLLRRGLRGDMLRACTGKLAPRMVWSNIASRAASVTRRISRSRPGRRRSRSTTRTDALESVLRDKLFGEISVSAPRRADVATVINACDLRTGSAARFGSQESAIWRLGKIVDNDVPLALAVAASAAYPLFLPAVEREFEFERDGQRSRELTVLADGGVFDNLGTSCLEPGRDATYSSNVFDLKYVIACDAGRGLLDDAFPSRFRSRVSRSFTATHRKAQDAARSRLYTFQDNDQLDGFVLAYLGVQDASLPVVPSELVTRDEVAGYPTDFSPMSNSDLERLSLRGEQLTRIAIDRWCGEL